jgi:hypothetical protein
MWKVRIDVGYWMTGVHSFKTKRAAKHFILRWMEINGGNGIVLAGKW